MRRSRWAGAIPVPAGLTILLIVAIAIGAAFALPASAQSTDETFDSVTAEVTDTAYFGGAQEVTFQYEGAQGSEVTFSVVGENSKTVTSDGSGTVSVRVGGFFFFGIGYPIQVEARTPSQTCTATINRGDGPVTFCEPQPGDGDGELQSFTGYFEDGFIQIGTGDNRSHFNLTECPGGQLAPGEDADTCTIIDATIHNSNNSWTAGPDDVTFPDLIVPNTSVGDLRAVVTAPNGLSGTIDNDTGRTTLNGDLRFTLPDLQEGCGLTVPVNATTDSSGQLTGTPLTINSDDTGRASLVDGTYEVPAATGCDVFGSEVNAHLGLPSPSGENFALLDMFFEFERASEPQPQKEFDFVTAEVTKRGYFGGARRVTFRYRAPQGETVEFEVVGENTDSETSDGTNSTESVRVGGFWFGAGYPLDVNARIVGGQQCSGTLNRGAGEVLLCERADQPANFDVSITNTNSPVSEGDTLTVDAEVTNTGDFEATQDITLAIDGTQQDSTSLTLAGGSSQTVSLDWQTASGDVGDHTAEVSSDNDTASETVTVEEVTPPNFQVTITDTNSPVQEGETLTVNADVENTGTQQGTQTITLDVGGSQEDSTSLTLAGGATQSVSLEWATSSGDAGSHNATVSSADDSDTATVTVEEVLPPNFQVTITGTNSPVSEGETLTVNADVQNTGDQQDTQTITLDIDSTQQDSTSLTLAGGASQSVSLDWATSSGDAGTHNATVSSANDSDSTTVTVEEVLPANFDVTITGTNSPVQEGQTLTVNADVSNTGDVQGTQTIALDIDGSQEDSTSLTLASGETQSVSLDWATADGDAGDHTANVSSDDDTASTTVTVEEVTPANFQVSITGTNSPVLEGETLTVNADVQNTGDQQGTQTVALAIDGSQEDSTSLTLNGGETQSVSLDWATAAGDAGSHNATVSSADSSDSTTVTVQAPANFQVSITDTNSPVVEGETLTVNADVTNNGDVQATQTITLDIDGTQEDSTSVTLASGATQSVSLSWATATGDGGGHTATVSSADTSDSASVTVQVPAGFQVSIASTNSPVLEGETLTVDADVSNTGDVQATQTITLAIDGAQQDSTDVTLAGGATQSVSLDWATAAGDAGSHTATVASDDTSDSATVNVQAPAFFDVAITGSNSPVVEGDTLTVNADVSNTGDVQATQTITLDIDGTQEDSTSVTLAGGASQSVSLDWATSSGDAGSHNAVVSSADASDSTTVNVQAPANFQVSIASTNSPVLEGETLTVTADVENTGGASGTQTVALAIDGSEQDSTSVSLNGGESTSVSLDWATSSGDAGDHNAVVSSDDDSASTTVTVQAPAFFDVAITGTNSPVVEGETLTVNADVSNTGDVQGTQTVTLDVDGTEEASTSLTVAGGATQSVSLDWATAAGDAGSHTATVASADTSDSTSVTVQEPAFFDVSIASTNSPVVEGDTLTVTADVSNTGDVQATQTVALDVDGTEQDSTDVTLAGGASQTVSLDWTTPAGSAGDHTATVSSADTSDSATVSVQAPPNFQVTITGTNSPVVEGETLTVDADVSNTGDVQGTQTVTLAIDGAQQDSTDVTLAGGATQSVSLDWATSSGDAGTHTATVSSSDDSASTSVEVLAPAFFDVSITGTNSPVLEGETLSVTADVSNTGGASDTQTVTLAIDGSEQDSTSVSLNGGESTSVSLSWTTASGDAGSHTANVSSDDDSATQSVTVQEPAFFDVSITGSNSPVIEGDTLTVNADVSNTGDVQGTQTITLDIDGTQEASTSLTVAGGATQSVSLDWATSSGDAGSHTATVASADTSDSTTVTVQEPAFFDVSIASTNSPVVEGDTLTVNADVSNTGDVQATQTITLDIDGSQQDSTSLTLAGGASQSVSLDWATAAGDAGDHNATVSSADTSDSATVSVQAPPNFQVSIASTNSPVLEGETLTVNADVSNTGDVQGTQTVALAIDGSQQDSTSVTLAGGASQSVSLDWSTSSGDAGTHTANVSSEDDSATATVTVQAPAFFDVSITGSNSPVQEGETLTVNADVQNTGDVQGTQTITLDIDGTQEDSTSLTVAGGATQSVSLDWATSSGDAGTHTATVSSADTSDSTNVTVEAPPSFFEVTIAGTNSPVTEGQPLAVAVDVTNTGGQQATKTVTLSVDGTDIQSKSVTLTAGETSRETFGWGTSSGDAGEHTATVSSPDDSDSRTITVQTPPFFDVSDLQPGDVTAAPGELVNVSATVTNTGQAFDNQTIELRVAGQASPMTHQIGLNGGESADVDFVLPVEASSGTFTYGVFSEDDNATATLSVEQPSENFDVSIQSTNSPVNVTIPLDVTAQVTNTGDAPGTQTVALSVGGTVVDSQSVSLNVSETTTLTLSWQTNVGDSGDHNIAVGSDDDTATTTVTVLPAPQSFTAYVEDGYLEVGTAGRRADLVECPNGVFASQEDRANDTVTECIKFNASVDLGAGTFSVHPDRFDFPTHNFPSDVPGLNVVPTNNTANDTITGTIDPLTGNSTFEADIRAGLEAISAGCFLSVQVSGTTGTSGNLTGVANPLLPNGTAEVTQVDNEFSVPEVSSDRCGLLASSINADVGLPAGPGNNSLVQELYIEFHEEPVDQLDPL